MNTTVTLNHVDLDAEARRARALRAAELLEGASWAIDDLISDRMRQIMQSSPDHAPLRERLHAEVRVALDLKANLLTIVQQHQAENTLNERRDRNAKPADHD